MWWLSPACTPDDGPGPGVPVEAVASARVRCADPAAREAEPYARTTLPGESRKPLWFWGVGLAAGDLDGDGALDLVTSGYWATRLWWGAGDGTFREGHLPGDFPYSAAVTFADVDGDADLDVLLTRYRASVVLLRNDGAGAFVDVTVDAGLSTEPRRAVPASFADVDRDGDLDLWIGGYGHIDEGDGDPNHAEFLPADPDWLYVNRGDGTFEDESERLPATVHEGYALAGGWHDVDRDGWPDLYSVHDFGNSFPSRLVWNREGALVPDGGAVGLDITATGMGLGVGDLNGDARDDWFVTAWNGNWLLRSGGGGAWFDYADVLGVNNDLASGQKIAWGVDLVDLDLDGDLDAPVTYGYLDSRYEADRGQPDAVYLQRADGTFEDAAAALGLDDPTVGRGYVAADLDDDGWLDLVRMDLDGPILVDLARCGVGEWLRVRLRQEGPNPFAVGARVDAHLPGGRVVSGVVRAGGTNYASAGPPEVHLGLGRHGTIPVLEVTWPDGRTSRRFDVDASRILTLTRR